VWAGVHPNWVTLAAIPLSTAAAWCIWHDRSGWGLLLALLASAMDFLDGEVARLQGRETAFGNYLEAVVDRWVDGVLLLGFFPHHPVVAGVALMLANLVSYSKARLGLVMPTDNRDWPGVGDRSDRLLLLLAAIGFGPTSFWGGLLLWGVLRISLLGTLQRIQHARRQIERAGL
jgi:phosphatidylglycerophosphate synthase